jgi:hypothetical protein
VPKLTFSGFVFGGTGKTKSEGTFVLVLYFLTCVLYNIFFILCTAVATAVMRVCML